MDNLSYQCYLTMSGRLLLNKMLAGDKLVLTKAIASSMSVEHPENLLYITPESHLANQLIAVANGDYTEITIVFLSSEVVENYRLNLIGVYGKIEGQNEDTLIYVCVNNNPFNVYKNLSLEFIFKIQETLTKGELTVEVNSNYACPISHLSDNYRHIFIQTNTSTSEAFVSSGLENNFVNGQTILFIPQVNLSTSAKLNIANTLYDLKYQDLAGNDMDGIFIAHKPYGMAYDSSDSSFVYKHYDKFEIAYGIPHYWDGVKWHSTMPAGKINAFDLSSTPYGYLLCNGATISKTTYPELFSAIGYRHGGSGDNFNLPNLQGRMLLGVNGSHSLGSTGGKEKQQLGIANMPAHTHNVKTYFQKEGTTGQIFTDTDTIYHKLKDELSGYADYSGVGPVTGSWNQRFEVHENQTINILNIKTDETSKGSGTAFEILNPYMSVNYYISTGKSLL